MSICFEHAETSTTVPRNNRSFISTGPGSKSGLLARELRAVLPRLLALYGLMVGMSAPGQTSSVTLAWDSSPDTNVVGYFLYIGFASGAYTNRTDAGAATTASVTGLVQGDTYYFTVTAYDGSGSESVPAAEVSYTVPTATNSAVAPGIVSQPTNQTTVAGSTATFQVSASGTAPLSYQWLFNGVNLSGATDTSLTLSNVQPSQAGGYSALVSNSAGSVTSAVAQLTVLVPPSFTLQPASQSVKAGSTVQFQAAADGTAPLSYQWFFNGASLSGANSGSLNLPNVQPAQAGAYDVVVANSAGSATSTVAQLSVMVPPSVTSEPTNQTVSPGGTATFEISAAGTAPLTYQWLFNGTNLAGFTDTMLTLNNVQPSQAGGYSAVVSNSVGSITSAVAQLTVLRVPTITGQPTNLTIVAGSTATFQLSASGSAPLSYQWLFNGVNLSGATDTSLTLSNIQPSQAGGYSAVVNNSAGSATSAVAQLTVLVPPFLTLQPTNQSVIEGSSVQFQAAADGTAPLSYQWFFNQTSVQGGNSSSLNLANVQPAQAGQYYLVVDNSVGSVTSAVAQLTVVVPPSITSQPSNQIVVAGSNATFQVTAAGTAPLGYQWLFNGTTLAGATDPALNLTNIQSNQAGGYEAVVSNSAGSITSTVAQLTVLGPPTIVSQPVAQTVIAGSNATFQLAASGSGPLTYQWLFNGANLGATGASLTLSNVQPSQAGGYSAIASNSAGSATSAVAQLTVVVPATSPVVTLTNPINGASYSSPATITLAADVTDNGNPITKVQFYNGTNLLGDADASPYSFIWSNVPAADYTLTAVAVYAESNAVSSPITIHVTSLPAPWQIADVGSTAAGSATGSNDSFAVIGAGTLSGYSDNFFFLYQPLTADGSITAQISSVTNAGTAGRFGVMIRENLTSGSRYAFMGISPDGKFRYQRRRYTDGNTRTITSTTAILPNAWVRLIRTGSTFDSYQSEDGTNWTLLYSGTITMATNPYIGIAVASGDTNTLATANFNSTSVTP